MDRSLLAHCVWPLLATACSTVQGEGGERVQLELLGVERSTDGEPQGDRPTPELWGANLLVSEGDSQLAFELGVMFADFGHPWRGDDELYGESHVGLRFYPAPERSTLQPYLGTGVLIVMDWRQHGDEYGYGEGDPASYSEDFWDWLFEGSLGAYLSAGLELRLEPLVLGLQARALFGEDVDRFAPHDDGFATELGFTVGVRL